MILLPGISCGRTGGPSIAGPPQGGLGIAIASQSISTHVLRLRLSVKASSCESVSIQGLGPGPVEIESRSVGRGTEIESRFFDSRSDADGSAPKLARGLRMPTGRHWPLRLRLYTRGTWACPCTSPARPAAPVKRPRLNIKGSSSRPLRTRLNLPDMTPDVTI